MIKIEQLLPLLKRGCVAMDKDWSWWWFESEPELCSSFWWPTAYMKNQNLNSTFDIEPAKDWTKSLMRCGDE